MTATHNWSLVAITDNCGRTPEELAAIARAVAAGGAPVILFRELDREPADMGKCLRLLLASVEDARISNPRLAVRVILHRRCAEMLSGAGFECPAGLAGYHLPDYELPPLPDNWPALPVLMRAAHSIEQVAGFATLPDETLEAVTLSPVFVTRAKPNAEPLGLQTLADARAMLAPYERKPRLIALGGISATNARPCIDAGADGVAVMSALFAAPNPEDMTRMVLTELALN